MEPDLILIPAKGRGFYNQITCLSKEKAPKTPYGKNTELIRACLSNIGWKGFSERFGGFDKADWTPWGRWRFAADRFRWLLTIGDQERTGGPVLHGPVAASNEP